MATRGRIPTPPAQQWRRFRYRYMPIATFLILGIVVLTLWQRHTGSGILTGEFYALSRDARTAVAGQLVELDNRPPIRIGDQVALGDVVAKLDSEPILRELAVTLAQLEQLRAEIKAEAETQRLNELDRSINLTDAQLRHLSDVMRLEERKADLQLQARDHEIVAAYSEILLKLEKDKVALFSRLRESLARQPDSPPVTIFQQADMLTAEVSHERIEQQLEQSKEAQKILHAQFNDVDVQLTELKAKAPETLNIKADLDTLTAPLNAAVEAQQARLNQIKWNLNALDVKAPISGIVRTIYYTPGQPVLAGEPIVTIASPASNTVVSYVRQEQNLAIKEGDRVAVRTRTRPRRTVEGVVAQIGPHQEQMPVLHAPQQDPNLPAWGVPVWIQLPDGEVANAIPGSLVDLWFKPRAE